MYELITSLHIHTVYSDGSGKHSQIAEAAIRMGLDVIIFTDHNVLVKGIEGYHNLGNKRVMMLMGEEVHDQSLIPQKDHLLLIGGNRELATYAHNTQALIDQANNEDCLTFLAHPFEQSLDAFDQDHIQWTNWDVSQFTGIEIWNGLSEIKEVANNALEAIFYVYFPKLIPHSPPAAVLTKWDELLSKGNKIVAVGGADAHALSFSLGFLHRTIFPYEYHFQTINTHLLVPNPLSGDFTTDRKIVLDALRSGHAFVGYDMPSRTRGFRFTAQGRDGTAIMGDEILLHEGVTIQVRLPFRTETHLIKDGEVIKKWNDRDVFSQFIDQPGIYRIESYIEYLGKKRGWIFSNPIYVRK